MPHHILVDHRRLALAAIALSLLLSAWALYVDPVINMDGILYVEAAEHFVRGQWTAGFSAYKWPFYSLLVGAVSFVTQMAGGHAAYLVNAILYVLAILGFVALVKVLGGAGRVLWLAAFTALVQPELNAFRSFVIRDVGYWACYLWSLAFFFAYVRNSRLNLLLAGTVAALLAFLFRIEGIALLAMLPACLYAARTGDRKRAVAALVPAALVTAMAVAAAPLWLYVSEVNVSTATLLQNPLHHMADSWSLAGSVIDDRLQALQREFPGAANYAAAVPAYIITVLMMFVLELIQTVGIVFSALIIYAFWKRDIHIPEDVRSWWWLLVGIQALLVLQFGISNFFLAKRYPVALALTLLPIVPFVLDDIWRRCQGNPGRRSWHALLIAVLIAVESLDGLDVATGKRYLKDAGLWLRANAPPGSSIYSNNRIVVYYSGLEKGRRNAAHTWDEAMREVWTDNWRAYDYFALAMAESERKNQVLLLKRIDAQPIKGFDNERGDQVLIFRPE